MQPARRVRGLPLLSNKTTTTTQALSPPQLQHSSVLRIRAPRRDDPSLLDAVAADARIQDKSCMLFSGTVVANGRGRAVVTA